MHMLSLFQLVFKPSQKQIVNRVVTKPPIMTDRAVVIIRCCNGHFQCESV